jgi:hypothetical protein
MSASAATADGVVSGVPGVAFNPIVGGCVLHDSSTELIRDGLGG